MDHPQNLRVLVTGASSGIGRATAIAFADAGASVAGLARRADRLERLQADHGISPVVGDLADMSAAAALMATAVDALGGLDVLVNSAGIAKVGLIADADPADWKAMFDVNVLGLLAITQAAIPHLAGRPGTSIVNISSLSGRRIPTAAGGAYSASKFAVHAITEALRMELQPQGVRVTTIAPGFVDTEIFDTEVQGGDSDLLDRYRGLTSSVGIRAEDVATAVLHAVMAPASVTTVEVAMVPTTQVDSAYKSTVDD